MPKILSCNPTGFFSYGVHQTVELDKKGLVLLDGLNRDKKDSSNGAGKTSLLNAITQIIFAKNPSDENGDAVVNEFLDKAFGRIVFVADNGIKWRITDTKRWRKSDKYPDQKLDPNYVEEASEQHNDGLRYSGTDVYFERWDETEKLWVDERSSNKKVGDARLDLKATRKKIIGVFGMEYDQFMSIAYLAQQQTMTFIKGTHKDKMAVLHDLCNLSAWDNRLKAVRERVSDLETDRLSSESTLQGLQRVSGSLSAPDPAQKEAYIAAMIELSSKMAECDGRIAALQMDQNTWKSSLSKIIADKESTVKQMREMSVNKVSLLNEIGTLSAKYADTCREIRERPRLNDINILETDISEMRGVIQARRYDLEQLLIGSGKCPRCRSTVTIEHLERQRELLKLEIRDVQEQVNINTEKLGGMIDAWQEGLKKDLDAATNEYLGHKDGLDSALQLIENMCHTLSLEIESLDAQRAAVGEDPQRRIDGVAQERLLFLSEKARHTDRDQQWDEQKKKHDEYQELIANALNNVHKYTDELRYLAVLDKMFGDKGIKAHKLNTLLARLNHTLKEYISIVTEDNINLHVTQYREKADGKLTADIQIMVSDGHKRNVPINLYSGGERQEIMLAFIGAFWQISSEYGSGLNAIFLDEILGPMDDVNLDNIFGFIGHLQNKGKSTILIVTHNETVKSHMTFDNTWTVVKSKGLSTISYGTSNLSSL